MLSNWKGVAYLAEFCGLNYFLIYPLKCFESFCIKLQIWLLYQEKVQQRGAGNVFSQ